VEELHPRVPRKEIHEAGVSAQPIDPLPGAARVRKRLVMLDDDERFVSEPRVGEATLEGIAPLAG
jgi:hypothetical protein